MDEKLSEGKLDREKIIEEIARLEFEAFDKVQNKGGRAECQDNWPYFYLMRASQYMTWTDEMLSEILLQWQWNKENGWNMITEKYGRMMEYTAPDEYEEIKDSFPKRSEQIINIIDGIVKIQVNWMEDFAGRYPNLAGYCRDITSAEDNLYNTSYETYLRGELMTYSDKLVLLYGRFVADLLVKGENLAELTISNTAKLQGYDSLEEAEAAQVRNMDK